MGNVMISLDERRERLLRLLARERHGGKKGSISAVVVEGLEQLARKSRKQRVIMHQIAVMKRGFDFGLKGKKAYDKRGDIYD